jgi:hypothetical protein
MKEIYSERKRQDIIKQHGKRYKELDFALISLKLVLSRVYLQVFYIFLNLKNFLISKTCVIFKNVN